MSGHGGEKGHSAEKDALQEAAQKVLDEHKRGHFCCHADRAPCVLSASNAGLCWAQTCMKCAPSPRDVERPEWPCAPVLLAQATRVLPPGSGDTA